jgi:hypothetical protein
MPIHVGVALQGVPYGLPRNMTGGFQLHQHENTILVAHHCTTAHVGRNVTLMKIRERSFDAGKTTYW